MWREVLDSDPGAYDLRSLTSITSTCEKLSPSTLRQFRAEICENVGQSYGSMEIHLTVLSNGELTEDCIESVGKPQSGTQVWVADPQGSVEDALPAGERGGIDIKSAQSPAWALRKLRRPMALLRGRLVALRRPGLPR
jgi:acetyl-CoA synthetase